MCNKVNVKYKEAKCGKCENGKRREYLFQIAHFQILTDKVNVCLPTVWEALACELAVKMALAAR